MTAYFMRLIDNVRAEKPELPEQAENLREAKKKLQEARKNLKMIQDLKLHGLDAEANQDLKEENLTQKLKRLQEETDTNKRDAEEIKAKVRAFQNNQQLQKELDMKAMTQVV